MNTKEFFLALDLIEKEKGISRGVVIEAFEHALVSAYKRNFNEAAEIVVKIDEKAGSIGIFTKKTVVAEVLNDATELTIEEAEAFKMDPDYGDVIEFEVTPSGFGRIATQTAKQVVRQRLKQAEQDALIAEMEERIGELITGIVSKVDERNAYIDLGKLEGVLPLTEVTHLDEVKAGERIRVYITRVEMRGKNLVVLVTRRDPNIIKKLFELEVPEIYEGTVKIVNVVRDIGQRGKVCVTSTDENIDPVGACVGLGGVRIRTIIEGLGGEKLDLIPFSEDPAKFVASSLSPANVLHVDINEEEKRASVIVDADQLSLAIGKRGQNVRLAAQLTGWKIDIKIDEEMETQRKVALEKQQAEAKRLAEEEAIKRQHEFEQEQAEKVSQLEALAALVDA
ncbi:MAG: transcription termination factor NusA [Defluviitaleaceae bacterium]|nr:transcription termination factor NusA [Defluviitaleaceae bacterium]